MVMTALIIALPLLLMLAIFLLIALSTEPNDQDQDGPDFTPDPMTYTQAGKLHPGSNLDKR